MLIHLTCASVGDDHTARPDESLNGLSLFRRERERERQDQNLVLAGRQSVLLDLFGGDEIKLHPEVLDRAHPTIPVGRKTDLRPVLRARLVVVTAPPVVAEDARPV